MKNRITHKSHLMECLEYMLVHRIANNTLSESTRVTYTSDIRNVVEALEALGHKPTLDSLQDMLVVDDVKLWLLNNKTTDGRTRSVATVQRKINCLKSLFNFWCDRCPKNPLTGQPRLENTLAKYKLKKVPRNDVPDALHGQELALLFSPDANWGRYPLRNRAILYLLLYTAARRESASVLKWSDIDFKHNRIALTGKGNKRYYVPLHGTLKAILSEHWAHEGHPVGNVPVFPSERGQVLEPKSISFQVKEHGKRNGVPRLYAHLLRHTALSIAARVLSQAETTRLAGHEDPDTTNRYYINVSIESMLSGIDSIDAVINILLNGKDIKRVS